MIQHFADKVESTEYRLKTADSDNSAKLISPSKRWNISAKVFSRRIETLFMKNWWTR